MRTFASCRASCAPGDLLVVNTTATLPAALTALREDGDEIALHWSTSLPAGLAVVEPRKVAGPPGESADARPAAARATLLAPYRDSQRLWIAQLDIAAAAARYLQRWGRPIAYPTS